jgi:hypothetical protein
MWGSSSLTLGRWLFVLSSILKRKTEMTRRFHQEAGLQQKEILPRRQQEGTGELFVSREMVEEVRVEAEKMPGLRCVRLICSGCRF